MGNVITFIGNRAAGMTTYVGALAYYPSSVTFRDLLILKTNTDFPKTIYSKQFQV